MKPSAHAAQAALWMLLASLLFATMGVGVKFASEHFNSLEIVFYRGLFGMVFLFGLTRARGVSLITPVPMMHVWRSIVGVISLLCWFYAIAELPLATAMTLTYMSSVWIATFLLGGAMLLQKRLMPLRHQAPLFVTVLLGFAGVAMVLRPTLSPDQALGGLAGLLAGLVSALAYLQVAALSRAGEPESRTVFYFSLGAVLTGGLGMLLTGVSPWHWEGAVWLLPVGLLAVLGQLCMTRAYASGATLLVANLQYSGIVYAAIYSLLIFDDHLPWIGWAGMVLIIVSGIGATALRERAMPHSPAEEHS